MKLKKELDLILKEMLLIGIETKIICYYKGKKYGWTYDLGKELSE